MSTRTLIPALKAHVGDWVYYVCVMKYGQVAKEIEFAHEMNGNNQLGQLIQRGISDRTNEITEYILKSEHRFLGSLIVAAWGGDPQYTPVKMEQTEHVSGIDSSFGILMFDGTQRYFALDGQHRLKAIKDAIKINDEISTEEISVILVSHSKTEQGRQKTRRLFTNINKNAKSTSISENIALDEDDGYAIINRWLIEEHPILSEIGRVAVFNKSGDSGELSIASNVKEGDKKAITSIKQLYEIIKAIGYGSKIDNLSKSNRPSESDLDDAYELINKRINDLLFSCGNIPHLIETIDDLRQCRKSKSNPGTEHPFLKGIIQRAIANVINKIMSEGKGSWDETMDRISKLDWKISSPPWLSVISINDDKGVKMITSREHTILLEDLIRCHTFPKSKVEIKKVRETYRLLKQSEYPVSQSELETHLR
jgi:DNA sulfur modification protein DndB